MDSANSPDYQNILAAFRSVYNFNNLSDYYTSDIPNFKKLITGLNSIEIKDRMIRRARDYLVKELGRWLKIIENDGKTV
jgi:hypothetical protein